MDLTRNDKAQLRMAATEFVLAELLAHLLRESPAKEAVIADLGVAIAAEKPASLPLAAGRFWDQCATALMLRIAQRAGVPIGDTIQ